MAAKTASLSVNIIADAAKARAGLKEAETAFGKFRREVGEAEGAMGKFKTIGSSALDAVKQNAMAFAAAGGAAVMAFAASSIKAASNLSESMNAVNVTFGKAADGILKFGETSAETVGMSSRQFNEFAVQFAGFARQVAGSNGDIVKVTTDVTKRVADFASVMNLDMSEAAQIFQSSLAGQTEPIRKFGIDMSAAAVETYALATGMVNSRAEMTESIKVQARYGLLMKETAKTSGDFKNTQDGVANATRTLQAKIEDLQAQLGEKLLPAMQSLLGFSLDLVDAFSAIGSALGKIPFKEQLGNFFEDTIKFAVLGPFNTIKNGIDLTAKALDALFGSSKNTVEVTDDMIVALKEGDDVMTKGRLATLELTKSVVDLGIQSRQTSNLTNGLSDAWKEYLGLLDKRDAFDNAKSALKEYEDTFKKAMKGNKESMDNLESSSRNAQRAIADAMEAADLIPKDQMKNILFLVQTGQLAEALRLLQLVDSWYVTVQSREMITPSGMGSGRTAPPPAAVPRAPVAPAPKAPAPPSSSGPPASFDPGLIKSKLKNIKGIATGGTITAGGMALVGEDGPELVSLPRGASVIPSIPSRKMMGGGTVVNISVQAGLVSSPDQVGAQIIDAIRRAERRSGQVFASV